MKAAVLVGTAAFAIGPRIFNPSWRSAASYALAVRGDPADSAPAASLQTLDPVGWGAFAGPTSRTKGLATGQLLLASQCDGRSSPRSERPTEPRGRDTIQTPTPVFPAISIGYTEPHTPTEGAARDRHGRGAGCGGRWWCRRRTALRRTAKSCGPDAPTLASSWRRQLRRRRWQESPVTGEQLC
jgi:hypothetical protein